MKTLSVKLKAVGGCWTATVVGSPHAQAASPDPVGAALLAARRAGHPDAVYNGVSFDSRHVDESEITLKLPPEHGGEG